MFSKRIGSSRPATKLSLESLMEAAGDVVFRTDRGGKIFYASQRALQVVGEENGGLEGYALFKHVVAEDRPLIEAGLTDAWASGATSRINARLNARDGLLWFELQITACESNDGQIEFLILGRDIAV